MPPWALKTALNLLQFYTKILQKINEILYSQNLRQNMVILSPFLGTLYAYKIANQLPVSKI